MLTFIVSTLVLLLVVNLVLVLGLAGYHVSVTGRQEPDSQHLSGTWAEAVSDP